MKFAFIADWTSNTATTHDQDPACRRLPLLPFSDKIQHTLTTEHNCNCICRPQSEKPTKALESPKSGSPSCERNEGWRMQLLPRHRAKLSSSRWLLCHTPFSERIESRLVRATSSFLSKCHAGLRDSNCIQFGARSFQSNLVLVLYRRAQ